MDQAVDGNALAGDPAAARQALLEKVLTVDEVLAELQKTNQ